MSFRSAPEPRPGSPPATTRAPLSRAAISSGGASCAPDPVAYDDLQEALLAACATLACVALPTI